MTNTDVLILKMNYKKESQIEQRKEEKKKILEELKLRKSKEPPKV